MASLALVNNFLNYDVLHEPKLLRKAASIFFLLIFLFNVGGYYFVFWALQHQANRTFQAKLDTETYANGDEVIITIPMTLPYPIHSEGFERVDGEFEYQGEYYSLIKQKLENDMLVLVCIKDHQQKKLANAMTEFSKVVHNVPVSSKEAFNVLAKLFKDYQSSYAPLLTIGNGWCREMSAIDLTPPSFHVDISITVPPPKGS